MKARTTFPKSMRLKRRRLIAALFERGSSDVTSIGAGRIRLYWRFASWEEAGPGSAVRCATAVGRRAGNAVVRNRVKRTIREAWRLNQHLITTRHMPDEGVLTFMLLYRGQGSLPRGAQLTRDVQRALVRLAEELGRIRESGRSKTEP